MKEGVNPKIGRRDLLRVLAIGAATATTSACSSAGADKSKFPDKRRARYQANSPEVQTFYRVNRYPAEVKEVLVLIKRTQQQPRRSPLPALPAAPTGDLRPPQLPEALRSRRRRPGRARHSAARRCPQGRGRPAAACRRDSYEPQECLHALLGRLLGDRRSRERRVDRAGAGLRQPDQSRLALLQGRGGARRRAERTPPALSGEARERPWNRISWDQAIDEIGDKLLEIRQKSGPDSVYWLGSAKFTNEAAYLNRKLAAFWGTNNSDHQARICHSTTVTGVANTWGYGAMTNSYNDIRNAKTILIMGGNPAEAHPVSLQHILEGKELNRANMIVVDPRMTRTAAHATEYVRVRPGTHIPTIYGMLWHIFENGWEDKEFLRQRVYGIEEIRKEVAKWPPDEVERVTGLPEAQVKHIAEIFAKQKPSTLIWAMGQTQFTTGTANVRASCILLLATGNVGHPGGGANIFRGHTNVQGATDLGLDVTTLPLYYGLAEEAWRHWCRVWEVDYDWMLSRFANKTLMETPGIPSTRWFDATLLPKDQVSQPDTVQAMFIMGHGVNTITRMPEAVEGIEKLELLVVCDPYPTAWSVLSERKNGTYLLPACTSFEMDGSRTASNRSLQWGEQIVEPIFECEERLRHRCICSPASSASPTRCSRTSRSRTARSRPKTFCARSIAAAGRPAIADSRPSGSRRT